MKEIRFKNDYEKLPEVWNGTQGTLISCYPETLTRLKNRYTAFFKNDTKLRFDKYSNRESYYHVSHENLLILVFIHHNTGKLIHTLRYNNEENFELYSNSLGETFKFIHS